MPSRSTRRSVRAVAAVATTLVTIVGLTVAGLTVAGGPSASASTRVPLQGSRPSWATAANAVRSAAASTTRYDAEIYFTPKPGVEAAARAASDPSSATYRHYLSADDWIAEFSPAADVVANTTDFVKSQGATAIAIPKSRLYVAFRATEAQLERIFSTSLATYEVEGTELVAPSSTPSLPAAHAQGVLGATIDQGRIRTRPNAVTRVAETAASQKLAPSTVTVKTPCSTYITQRTVRIPTAYGTSTVGTANCGYSPKQLRSAYGLPSTATGAGQTVAIIDAYASPTIVADVNTASAGAGIPKLTAGQYTQVIPDRSAFSDVGVHLCGLPSDWQGEQELDVQAVHGLAPAAKIVYEGGTNCESGLDIALSDVIDNGRANLVSMSFGSAGEPLGAENSAYVASQLTLQQQAAAEGIGLYYASGDDGDEKAATRLSQPDFPGSSPWATAVGGTSLGLSKTNSKIFETGWGDQLDRIVVGSKKKLRYVSPLPGTLFAGGSGGGRSRLFAKPAYQNSVVPTSVGAAARATPDLAALADPFTGFRVGYRPITNESTLATGSFSSGVVGGTSLAAPLTVAIMASIQQKTQVRVGFANPTLYKLAKSRPGTFVDVQPRAKPTALAYSSSTNSYLVTLQKDTSLKTLKGYDTVTGLGGLSFAAAQGFSALPAP